MVRIANMLAKIPLDVESKDDQPAEQSGSGHTYAPAYAPAQGHWGASGAESSKQGKRKAVQIEICVQCESSFEEGDESLTCRYHPGEFIPLSPRVSSESGVTIQPTLCKLHG